MAFALDQNWGDLGVGDITGPATADGALLVAFSAVNDYATTVTISDSSGVNTWTEAPVDASDAGASMGNCLRLFYCLAAAPVTQVVATPSGGSASRNHIGLMSFTAGGDVTLDDAAAYVAAAGSTWAVAAVTPSQEGDLVVGGIILPNTNRTVVLDAGDYTEAGLKEQTQETRTVYDVSAEAGTTGPTWSITSGSNSVAGLLTVAFAEEGAASTPAEASSTPAKAGVPAVPTGVVAAAANVTATPGTAKAHVLAGIVLAAAAIGGPVPATSAVPYVPTGAAVGRATVTAGSPATPAAPYVPTGVAVGLATDTAGHAASTPATAATPRVTTGTVTAAATTTSVLMGLGVAQVSVGRATGRSTFNAGAPSVVGVAYVPVGTAASAVSIPADVTSAPAVTGRPYVPAGTVSVTVGVPWTRSSLRTFTAKTHPRVFPATVHQRTFTPRSPRG